MTSRQSEPTHKRSAAGCEDPRTAESRVSRDSVGKTIKVIILCIGITLICLSLFLHYKNEMAKTIATTTAAASPIALGCGNDGFIEPTNPSGITPYIIMPTEECWTDIIVRPTIGNRRSPKFQYDPKGRVIIQVGYGRDQWEDPYETAPGDTTTFRGITTMRFMSATKQPVLVNIVTR